MQIITTGIKSKITDLVIDVRLEENEGKFYPIVNANKMNFPSFFQLVAATNWAQALHLTNCLLYLLCASYEHSLLGEYGPAPTPELKYLEGEVLKYVDWLRQFKGFRQAEKRDREEWFSQS